MMRLVITIIAMLIISGIIVFMRMKTQRSQNSQDYLKKSLLTDNEKEFFGRLIEALPGFHVFSQVAMGAILQPAASKTDKRNYYRIRGTFAQKIVDYVVCDKNMDIIVLIELDDRTHSIKRDVQRDAMLIQAGYVVLRYDSKKKPSADLISKIINQQIATRTISGKIE